MRQFSPERGGKHDSNKRSHTEAFEEVAAYLVLIQELFKGGPSSSITFQQLPGGLDPVLDTKI